MICPVCSGEARNATPETYRGLVIECPACGLYRVTERTVPALDALKREERLSALRKAKNFCSSRLALPTISSGCVEGGLPNPLRKRRPPQEGARRRVP